MNNPNLFVVTGGPGTGKTTVLGELQRLGHRVVPEVARQIIQEQRAGGGTALPWADRERYTELMLRRSIESFVENTPGESVAFSDRGIPDTLGYARLIGLPNQSEIIAACREYRYSSLVFLFPAWQEIYVTDKERKQDFEEAVRTTEVLRDVYHECGYEVVEVPRLAVEERAKFALKLVGPIP